MKKVLVFKSDLLPYSETFIKEQALAYKRWIPVLVGSHRLAGLSLEGLEVRLLRRFPHNLIAKAYWKLLREFDVAPPRAVIKVKRERASLVHVHFGNEAVAFWPIIRKLRLPVVVTLHGADINTYREWWEAREGVAGRKYPERLLAIARESDVSFIAVSEAIRHRAIEYGIPGDKITVQYIGIDTSRFRSSGPPINQRGQKILYVGRMIEKKGGQFLVQAFARVRAAVPEAELEMVGDGPALDSLKNLAVELSVPIQFPGSLSSAAVKERLDKSRVFCLPSITAKNGDAEGLGIVLLEAQACGLPVVTSARGGATEGVLDGTTGFAFAERDVPSLADKLVRLLKDDALAMSMSEAGPQFIASRFDIRQCTCELEAYYDSLLGESGPNNTSQKAAAIA